MGLSSGIPATQISFDFKFGKDYSASKIKSSLEFAFNTANVGYFLGCEIGAWEVNWQAGGYTAQEIRHMTQGGIDCFITNPEYSSDFKLQELIGDVLSRYGCTLLGVDTETVYYEADYINYISKWYTEPRSTVVDNLINAGYIDSYDRSNYVEVGE